MNYGQSGRLGVGFRLLKGCVFPVISLIVFVLAATLFRLGAFLPMNRDVWVAAVS